MNAINLELNSSSNNNHNNNDMSLKKRRILRKANNADLFAHSLVFNPFLSAVIFTGYPLAHLNMECARNCMCESVCNIGAFTIWNWPLHSKRTHLQTKLIENVSKLFGFRTSLSLDVMLGLLMSKLCKQVHPKRSAIEFCGWLLAMNQNNCWIAKATVKASPMCHALLFVSLRI